MRRSIMIDIFSKFMTITDHLIQFNNIKIITETILMVLSCNVLSVNTKDGIRVFFHCGTFLWWKLRNNEECVLGILKKCLSKDNCENNCKFT